MTGHSSYPERFRPLSIGNAVSLGVRLYRSHFKTYLKLAIFAYLWLLAPIYGWAKYLAISGLIARLAFGELINQPESVKAARRHVNRRLWAFLGLTISVGGLFIGVFLGIAIAMVLVWGFQGRAIAAIIHHLGEVGVIGGVAIAIAILALSVISLIWLVSRLLFSEVPLAIEADITIRQSIVRSWVLTRTLVYRVIGIAAVSSLVTLPVVILMDVIPDLLITRLETEPSPPSIAYPGLLILRGIGGVFELPFWQTIKAVLYFDLRSRKEGLDLRLRDPKNDESVGL